MNVQDKLKDRIAARRQDDAARYWQCSEKLASGRLNDKETEVLLEQIATLLPLVGKVPGDVDEDLATIGELVSAEGAEAAMAAAERDAKELVVQAGAVEAKAEVAHAETQRLRDRAQALRHSAGAALQGARERLRALNAARRRLAERGHPGFGEFRGVFQ